jgi:nicotinamidase-related amidase
MGVEFGLDVGGRAGTPEQRVARLRPPERATGLLVIDIQERLVPALDADHAPRFVRAAANLIALAALRGWPVRATVQYPKGLGPLVPEIARELAAAKAPPPLEKVDFSAMRAPGFDRGTVPYPGAAVLVGCEAHVCVLETALDLLERGVSVFVPWDAVASRREEDRRRALDLLQSAGAVVTSSETLIFQSLGRAGTPEFKAMAPRLK